MNKSSPEIKNISTFENVIFKKKIFFCTSIHSFEYRGCASGYICPKRCLYKGALKLTKNKKCHEHTLYFHLR